MKQYIKPELELMKMDDECFISTSDPTSANDEYSSNDDMTKDRSNYKHDSLGWDF